MRSRTHVAMRADRPPVTHERLVSDLRATERQDYGPLAALVAKHPGETIVAVSHADPIKAAVAHAMGTHLDLFQRIVVSPCSVSAIAYSTSGPVVLTVNSLGDDLTKLAPS